jgi:thioredoxin reductase
VAIIGAGPYGLSIAAHLHARGSGFRIFGQAMESWRTHMPAGMLLKSEGFASSLSDPQRRSTLAQYCREQGLAYGDTGVPIPLATITGYGQWFQREHVPGLEARRVAMLERSPRGFQLRLEDGETLAARHVVLAVGGGYFAHVPDELRHLPAELLSHSDAHHDLHGFRGRDVTVLGGGASAFDFAALLKDAGAEVRLVSRRPALKFHARDKERTAWHKLRYPLSGIGPGWRNCFFTHAPWAFRHLPEGRRSDIVRTHLGPAGAWWMKELIVGRVPVLLGCRPVGARAEGARVRLQLRDGQGAASELVTDHVIAATGYKVDVRRVAFLSEEIRASLRTCDGAPALSGDFESSVAGLHFAGLASTFQFGPVMRFICGADYAARRLSGHLAHTALRGRT